MAHVLALQWEEVIVNVDTFYKLRQVQNVNINHEDNYKLIEPNRLVVRWLSELIKTQHVIIFSLYHRLSTVRRHCQFLGLNRNITYTRLLSPAYTNLIEEKLEDTFVSHYNSGFSCFFLVANKDAYLAIDYRLQAFKSNCPDAVFHYMLPYMGRNGYFFFYDFSKEASPELVEKMNFVNTDVGIKNIMALETGHPEKASFFIHTFGLDILGVHKRYYLFDYYSTSKTTEDNSNFWNNPLSHEMIAEIKGNNRSTRITRFFCETLIHYIETSNIDLNTCAFLIMPSHKTNKWNSKIYDVLSCVLSAHGWNHNTLHGLVRLYEIEEQHSKKAEERTTDPLISSLAIDPSVDLNLFDYSILIDDFVTSGTSFDAASTVIKTLYPSSIVKSFAIAGARKSYTGIITEKKAFCDYKRPHGTTGYIFDLDNTILNTEPVRSLRDSCSWKEIKAEDTIPFSKIVKSIKELLLQDCDVAIVTSSPKQYCIKLLTYIGIQINEVVIVAHGDTEQKKPSAAPFLLAEYKMSHYNRRIICVGDDLNDMQACINAGDISIKQEYIPVYAGWLTGRPISYKKDTDAKRLNEKVIECLREDDFVYYLSHMN